MQRRGTLHSPKLQHCWNLTIILFSVISRTLVRWGGGLTPLQRCSQCILQPQLTGQFPLFSEDCLFFILFYFILFLFLVLLSFFCSFKRNHLDFFDEYNLWADMSICSFQILFFFLFFFFCTHTHRHIYACTHSHKHRHTDTHNNNDNSTTTINNNNNNKWMTMTPSQI